MRWRPRELGRSLPGGRLASVAGYSNGTCGHRLVRLAPLGTKGVTGRAGICDAGERWHTPGRGGGSSPVAALRAKRTVRPWVVASPFQGSEAHLLEPTH